MCIFCFYKVSYTSHHFLGKAKTDRMPNNSSLMQTKRKKSSSKLATFGESVAETTDGLKNSLYSFKSDLLSLKHQSRYSGKQNSNVF